jgi:hypothetical protein
LQSALMLTVGFFENLLWTVTNFFIETLHKNWINSK